MYRYCMSMYRYGKIPFCVQLPCMDMDLVSVCKRGRIFLNTVRRTYRYNFKECGFLHAPSLTHIKIVNGTTVPYVPVGLLLVCTVPVPVLVRAVIMKSLEKMRLAFLSLTA